MGYERELSARQKALDLSKRREEIETEISAIITELTENGGPGLSGNLVDGEGFPRADIDIHAVRIKRNRLHTLKTDYKVVTAEMEKYMHLALARPENGETASSSTRGKVESSTATASSSETADAPTAPALAESTSSAQRAQAGRFSAPAPAEVPPPRVPRRQPFALVDLVTPSSPADSAGLKLNDKIIAFGAVSLQAFATPTLALGALPGLLREHENREVEVQVERGENASVTVATLSLIPRRWSGQGLLGCHVVPIAISQEDSIYRPDVATATAQRTLPPYRHA